MPKKSTASGDAIEKDAGYGESHGYSKSHGGPTGPGDAPAKPSPKAAAKAVPTPAAVSDAIDHDGRDSRRSAPKSPSQKATSSNRNKGGGARVDRSRSQ